MVRNVKVPFGYKKTEVGVIPNDWEACELLKCCSKITDGTHDTPKQVNDGVPFLTAIHVKENYIDYNNCYYLPKSIHEIIYKRCNPEQGDVLMVNIGAGVATTALVVVNYEFSLKNVALLKPNNKKIIGSYLNYYQLFNKVKINNSVLTGGAQPFLSLNQIGKLIVALPDLQEQATINEALSGVYELITLLDKMIGKKKNIKKGTSNLLLSGKKRLKGFIKEWELKTLGEIGETYGGLSGKSKKHFEGGRFPYIPFLNIMNNPIIDTKYFDYVNIGMDEKQNKAQKGDLFFNGSSETPEDVGMCSVLLADVNNLYLNSFCFGFRLKNESKSNAMFLAHFFRSSLGRKLIYSSAQGATRYNLSKSNFNLLEIPYPEFEEQTAIAQILSDMDKEIKLLEQKRNKYKDIKQGMMEKLLTGKVRLV